MQSIISAFPDTRSAQAAIERLVQQGIDRSSIHLQSADPNAGSTSGAGTRSVIDPFGFASFFSTVFGAGSSAEAGKYAEAVRRGNTVVVLDVEDAVVDQATRLMEELGSIDIDMRAAAWQSRGWAGFDAEAKPLSEAELAFEREQTVVPVIQEELQVGKRAVQGGGVRVVKRVTETPVVKTVTLRDEHTTVERRPVDRAVGEDDLGTFEESTVELREMSEEAVVSKTARVVEEVVVGMAVRQRAEKVADTVRRTDVDVERVDTRTLAESSK